MMISQPGFHHISKIACLGFPCIQRKILVWFTGGVITSLDNAKCTFHVENIKDL
jgi:hypothetical protein